MSVASGVDNIISALPFLNSIRVELAVLFVIVIVIVNLRGVREASAVFAIPTYVFIGSVLLMIVVGIIRMIAGDAPVASSAQYTVQGEDLGQAAVILLILRAFSSGCSALTGVEAVSNGVPAFRKPKIRNAQMTLTLMGGIATCLFAGLTLLALVSGVHYAENPCHLVGFDCVDNPQPSLMAQVAAATFGMGSIPFFLIQAVTALVLLLAANTAFNGFPLLGSVLARDGYAPKALNTRGDRLVYSNGMIILGLGAIVVLVVYQANLTNLIQLYIIGVFVSFSLGADRHDPALAAQSAGASGAACPSRRAGCRRRHAQERPDRSRDQLRRCDPDGLRAPDRDGDEVHPRCVARLHRHPDPRDAHGGREPLLPRRRARDRPRRRHPLRLVRRRGHDPRQPSAEAGHQGDRLRRWPPSTRRRSRCTCRSPRRRPTSCSGSGPSIRSPCSSWSSTPPTGSSRARWPRSSREYRRKHGSAVVTVYLPQYIVGHWWESVLHNRRSRRIANQLMMVHGVSINLVPWLLDSTELIYGRRSRPLPGQQRSGLPSQTKSIPLPGRRATRPAGPPDAGGTGQDSVKAGAAGDR